MTTERLQEFAVLSSTLNYSNAAHILFITQSTLSRHIAEMEEELGFQLFNRTTRNVELTEAGRQFSISIGRLLKKYDAAISRLYIKGIKASGNIKITYTHSASFPPFLDFCKRFNAKYPGIDLELEMSPGFGLANISSNSLYFSPAAYDELPKNVKMLHVFQQSAYLLYPPNHPLASRHTVALRDLRGETLYIPQNDAEINGPFSRAMSLAVDATDGDLRVVIAKSNTSALVNVSLGKGVTILPRSQILEEYRNLPCSKLYEPDCNFDINVYYDAKELAPSTALFLSELLPTQLPESFHEEP